MKRALLICAIFSLTACTTPEQEAERKKQIEQADHAECLSLGFRRETAEYGDCRLRLREMRQRERALRQLDYGVGFGFGRNQRFGRGGVWF